jgi:preprotein translocase subunit SecA
MESFRRVHQIDLFDVQIQAGLSLISGGIAEVQTGEGKTFIAAIPAFVFSLFGRGVHVSTTNEYLSQRDYDEIRPVLRLLGVTVGCLHQDDSDAKKRNAYECDVTYGPGYEFGFHFLRDQIRTRQFLDRRLGGDFVDRLQGRSLPSRAPVQSRRSFAIIDEADSVLIDEANTPLVLSGATGSDHCNLHAMQVADRIAKGFVKDRHYRMKGRSLELLSDGNSQIQDCLSSATLGELRRPWQLYVSNSLRANHLFTRDVDYVVQDDKVAIVDSHTGRIHDERTWQNGLHQAVEVKEGLEPSPDNVVDARITRQRFLQKYDLICGLTGTAKGNESDFRDFYGMSVKSFDPNKPCQRTLLPTRFFATEEAKQAFVVTEATQFASQSRSVIVGTRSIQEANQYFRRLEARGAKVEILHGLQDRDEAEVIKQAGSPGQITVTTSIAGRGTDIRLSPAVRDAGGLHVIATQFNDSARVDRQLAGRTARQGDPGSARWTCAPNDSILANHDLPEATRIRRSLCKITEELGIGSDRLNREVKQLHQRIEAIGYDSRAKMVAHDRWMESIQKVVA